MRRSQRCTRADWSVSSSIQTDDLLAHGRGGMNIEVQKVDHPSPVHLDIESTDVEAEVARLETLGAKRLNRVEDWVVMEAPPATAFASRRHEHPHRRRVFGICSNQPSLRSRWRSTLQATSAGQMR